MWQRFAEMTRTVIFLASQEAQKRNDRVTTPLDILVCLLRLDNPLLLGALMRLEVDRERLLTDAQALQIPAIQPYEGGMELSAASKRVIDIAYEEARNLKDKTIEPEHLFLGIVRVSAEEETLAPLLASHKIEIERTRKELLLQRCWREVQPEHKEEDREITSPHDQGSGVGMWQRFTERTRRVIFFAQEEAARLGENFVGTEHLLLGLVRENDSVAARILERLGVNLARVRQEIDRQVSRGDGRLGTEMQLTPRAKRVIDLAYEEARTLNNNYIGTEHLLLALVRESEGIAGQVLARLGVQLERTRREVMSLQDGDGVMTPSNRTPDAQAQTTPAGAGATTFDAAPQGVREYALAEAFRDVVQMALAEDLTPIDLTSELTVPAGAISEAVAVAKAEGVLAGIDAAREAFRQTNPAVNFIPYLEDGMSFTAGTLLFSVQGNSRRLLSAERTALNLLQHLSGIATATAQYVETIRGTKARIVDTRKTTPGLRFLEKYAVRKGGGFNHRYNLSDGILIKDNHIVPAGGITAAIVRARAEAPHTLRIEIEVTNPDEIREALAARADVLLLDNMTQEQLSEAVKLIEGRALTEASGGITLETVRAVAETGVDFISVGALTHSVRALDISLQFQQVR